MLSTEPPSSKRRRHCDPPSHTSSQPVSSRASKSRSELTTSQLVDYFDRALRHQQAHLSDLNELRKLIKSQFEKSEAVNHSLQQQLQSKETQLKLVMLRENDNAAQIGKLEQKMTERKENEELMKAMAALQQQHNHKVKKLEEQLSAARVEADNERQLTQRTLATAHADAGKMRKQLQRDNLKMMVVLKKEMKDREADHQRQMEALKRECQNELSRVRAEVSKVLKQTLHNREQLKTLKRQITVEKVDKKKKTSKQHIRHQKADQTSPGSGSYRARKVFRKTLDAARREERLGRPTLPRAPSSPSRSRSRSARIPNPRSLQRKPKQQLPDFQNHGDKMHLNCKPRQHDSSQRSERTHLELREHLVLKNHQEFLLANLSQPNDFDLLHHLNTEPPRHEPQRESSVVVSDSDEPMTDRPRVQPQPNHYRQRPSVISHRRKTAQRMPQPNVQSSCFIRPGRAKAAGGQDTTDTVEADDKARATKPVRLE